MGFTKISRPRTLTRFLIEEQRRYNHATGGFTGLVNDVRLAVKRIAGSSAKVPCPMRSAPPERPTFKARRR